MLDLENLKSAARAATPQNLDTAQSADHYNDSRDIPCPSCGGEGSVELEADFLNYDGKALGVQFYGIGAESGAAEAYFRAASPAAVLKLIERLERAESALAAHSAGAQAKLFDMPDEEWLDVWGLVEKTIPNVFGSYAKVRGAFAREAIRIANEAQPHSMTARDGFEADAKRLALELECLLNACKDTAIVSKWWDSGIEALEQHRAIFTEIDRIGRAGASK